MATRPEFFTASEVGNIVTGEVDDPEYIFPGRARSYNKCMKMVYNSRNGL